MNEEDKKFLGSTLKALRKASSYTTRKLAEKIGFSHSYISAVENFSKTSPSNEFIQKYLLVVNDMNVDNANYFINLINKHTSDDYNFELLPKPKNDISDTDDGKLKEFSDIHVFSTYKKGRKNSENVFEEPINDLSFHLNDVGNAKFYKGLELDHQQLAHINDMINSYLIEVYNTRFKQVNTMFLNREIDKEVYKKYAYNDIKNLEKLGKKDISREQQQIIDSIEKHR